MAIADWYGLLAYSRDVLISKFQVVAHDQAMDLKVSRFGRNFHASGSKSFFFDVQAYLLIS